MTGLMVALLFLAPSLSLPRAFSAAPQANGNDRPTVVVLGDSLAAGYGLDLSEAFPALLQKKIDDEVTIAIQVLGKLRDTVTVPKGMAREELEAIKNSGAPVHFVWMGGKARGEPHYYRVQGKSFLIEYDNVQNEADDLAAIVRDSYAFGVEGGPSVRVAIRDYLHAVVDEYRAFVPAMQDDLRTISGSATAFSFNAGDAGGCRAAPDAPSAPGGLDASSRAVSQAAPMRRVWLPVRRSASTSRIRRYTAPSLRPPLIKMAAGWPRSHPRPPSRRRRADPTVA